MFVSLVPARNSRHALRPAIALGLAMLSTVAGLPRAESSQIVRDNGRTYRLELGAFDAAIGDLHAPGGKAGLRLLQADESGSGFSEALDARWSRGIDGITVTYATPDDRLSLTVPDALLRATAGDRSAVAVGDLWVEVNGDTRRIDALQLLAAAGGDSAALDAVSGALDGLDRSFVDAERFKAAHGLLWSALVEALDDGSFATPAHSGCFLECMECAVRLAAMGVSLVALLAACGATLGLACLAALLGHEVAVAVSFIGCGHCVICLDKPCPCKPDHPTCACP